MLFVWLAIGVVLLAFELHHLALYLLFASIGAFAAAAVAIAAPHAVAVQGIVAAATAVGGVVVLRPRLSTVVHRREGRSPAKGVHGGLVGHPAIALDMIGAIDPGHVRLAGERWLAVSDWSGGIGPNVAVVVTAVVGTTLHVVPTDPTGDLAHTLEAPGS